MNPNHDPHTGEFSSGPGGAPSGHNAGGGNRAVADHVASQHVAVTPQNTPGVGTRLAYGFSKQVVAGNLGGLAGQLAGAGLGGALGFGLGGVPGAVVGASLGSRVGGAVGATAGGVYGAVTGYKDASFFRSNARPTASALEARAAALRSHISAQHDASTGR